MRHALQRAGHHARPGHADGHDAVRLFDTVEGTRHERVIAHGVSKDHQLGAGDGAAILCERRGVLDHLPHLGDCIHIQARPGGAHVHGGAHGLGDGEGLRDGFNEPTVAGGHSLFHQRGITTDEVHAGFLRRAIQCLGQLDRVALYRSGQQGNRGDRDAPVHNRDTQLALNTFARADQVLGLDGEAIINSITGFRHGPADTVEEADAHRHGTNVQAVFLDHLDGVPNGLASLRKTHDSP